MSDFMQPIKKQITPVNDLAKKYLDRLSVEEREHLENQLSDYPVVHCIGYSHLDNFDYVSFFTGDVPKVGEWAFDSELKHPVRYSGQENVKKIISFSIGKGELL